MDLTHDLISDFVKSTKDDTTKSSESTVHATTVEYNGRIYVKIDGSDLLTPVSKTVDVKADERVTVLIKDHEATVTGNLSSPAARTDDVKEVAGKMTEVEILMAYKVTTDDLTAVHAAIENLKATNAYIDNMDVVKAEIESLEALFANVEHLTAKDIETITAKIESVEATFGTFTNLSTGDLEAINAEIGNLKAYAADFTYVSAEVLEAVRASIKTLETEKLSAKEAALKYANIDFANISEATIKKLFTDYGIIKELIISEGTVVKQLVGVTIKGDLIEGGTVKADKLVVKGSDGLYYKLNFEGGTFKDGEEVPTDGLHGSVIVAESITAEKISVDDLVAFGATIGGFEITDDSIHSQGKDTADNTTRGVYLDNDGQVSFGDESNFIRYYKDQNGNYKLEITAQSILFGSSKKSVDQAIQDEIDNLKIGGRNLLKDSRHIQLHSNNGTLYPITYETLLELDREFRRYSRTETSLNPTTMSLYSSIPVTQITEQLCGKEMTFSFLIRCSHEASITTMNDLYIDGSSYNWSPNDTLHEIGLNWTRVSITATIEQDYEQKTSNLLRFNPLSITIPTGEVDNFYIDVCEWKIEAGNKATDWTPAPEDVDETIVATTNEIQESIINQHSTITGEYETAILKALEDYNKTGDFEEFKNAVLTDLGLMGGEIDSNLNSTTERINSVDADLQSKFANLDNYVHIDNEAGTITLGSGDSKITLTLENDAIVFRKRGELEPFGYWNGVDFYTGNIVVRTEQRAQFGNFAFVPRTDGSLSFLKVGDL